MPSEIAAGYIEAFANGSLHDPYSWDDFELMDHANPEVALALKLCGHAASLHPPRNDREYMAPSGVPHFKHIAALLRSGALKAFVSLGGDAGLPEDLPVELKRLLEKGGDGNEDS